MGDLLNDSRDTPTSSIQQYVWPVLLAFLSAGRAWLYQGENDQELFFLFSASAAVFVVAALVRRRWPGLSHDAIVWGAAVHAAASALRVIRHPPPAGHPMALYVVISFLAPVVFVPMAREAGRPSATADDAHQPDAPRT